MVHFISGVTHMETNVLFCSKLMFTNGKIVVCKYTIRFYSGLCFCQTHIWTSIFLFYFFFLLPRIVHWMSGVTRVENDLLFC